MQERPNQATTPLGFSTILGHQLNTSLRIITKNSNLSLILRQSMKKRVSIAWNSWSHQISSHSLVNLLLTCKRGFKNNNSVITPPQGSKWPRMVNSKMEMRLNLASLGRTVLGLMLFRTLTLLSAIRVFLTVCLNTSTMGILKWLWMTLLTWYLSLGINLWIIAFNRTTVDHQGKEWQLKLLTTI